MWLGMGRVRRGIEGGWREECKEWNHAHKTTFLVPNSFPLIALHSTSLQTLPIKGMRGSDIHCLAFGLNWKQTSYLFQLATCTMVILCIYMDAHDFQLVFTTPCMLSVHLSLHSKNEIVVFTEGLSFHLWNKWRWDSYHWGMNYVKKIQNNSYKW